MAGIPLGLTLPAAAAAAAYVNARYSISSDLGLLVPLVTATISGKRAEKQNKINPFYTLESHAKSAKTANRTFLAIPPTISRSELQTQSPKSLASSNCTEYSYKQIYELVLKYAAWLKQEYGVQKRDVVALDWKNDEYFVILWFAIWSLGARPAFINTNLRSKALIHCIRTSTARVVLLDPALEDALSEEYRQELRGSATTVLLDESMRRKIEDLKGLRVPDEERSGQKLTEMAILIYTSGTTGLPKPAVVPWRKVYMSATFVGRWMGLKKDDRYYSALPLYHTSAAILGLSVALQAAATYIISPRFSPSTFFASCVASHATHIQYIGEMCRYLLSQPPSPFDTAHTIRMAFGNGLRPDVWQQFKDRFAITEIAEFYGATEAPSATFIKSKNSFGAGVVGRSGAVMKLFMGAKSAILKHDVETGEPYRNAQGFCERVALGESGEMVTKLDPAAVEEKYAGYFGNEKASHGKLLRDVLEKGDVWYRTGDLLKQDSEGRTFFVDRIGDTFRWKAENVSTNEVAEVVSQYPGVKEVNVYGVQLPKHDGRAGCAALILEREPSQAWLQGLAEHSLRGLPRFACPIFLRVVEKMEVTGTSKYQKNVLRNEGVDPDKVKDRVFWLPPGGKAYVEFGQRDWEGIAGGGVKL